MVKIKAPTKVFKAFENPDYRLLWPANFLSQMGRWMQMFILQWFVLEKTGSIEMGILVGFAGTIPMLVLGPFGGQLDYYFPRRQLLILSQGACLATAITITVLLATKTSSVPFAYLGAAVIGAAWALEMPARRSAIHDLLGSSGVTNGLVLDTVGASASKMLGPMMAGILIYAWDFPGAYSAVFLLYFTEMIFLSQFNPPIVQQMMAQPKFLNNLMSGLHYVKSNRIILATVMVTVIMNLLLFPHSFLIPGIAKEVFKTNAFLAGLLQSAVGVGALIGAISIASATNIRNHGQLYLGGSVLSLLALLLFSTSKWYPLSLPMLVTLGIGTAGFSTMQSTLIVLTAEKNMRSQALGAITVAIGTGPLGILSLTVLVAVLNAPQLALGLNAVVGLTALLAIGLVIPTLISPSAIQINKPKATSK